MMRLQPLFQAAVLAAGFAVPAAAALSRLINFQGRLTDTSANPITSATTLEFDLFAASSGGSSLYTENRSVTPDSDGLYSLNIGEVTSLAGVDFSQDLWLAVRVNGELLPSRYRLTGFPYSIYASSAAAAATAPWSGVTGVSIVDGDISASAEISASKINGGSFQNESYSFPNGAAIGGSTITATGNLQMPSGATITIGSVSGTLLPSGTMILTINTCPTGFTEYTAARGLYLVGVPSGGTAAGTVGSAMTNLADATHSHTIATTQVSNLTALGGTSAVATVTSPSGTVARSAIAPYIQVRLCTAP